MDSAALAVSHNRAAKIAGISLAQLNYWVKTGLIQPSISRELGQRFTVRLYTLPDMVALMLASQLRGRVSLQHIRRTVAYLRHQGFDAPLSELRFAVEGHEIYFQLPDGDWYGDRAPSQSVAAQSIPLQPLIARVREGVRRPADAAGRIERVRQVHASKPVFAGTRVPVSAVQAYLKRGLPDERILAAFPILTRDDIEAARTFAA
jgi:uncharacterized protein (DUF433 family)